MNPKRVGEILTDFAGKRVIVIGDLMLDEFIWGAVRRISPEAPVPVVEVSGETWHAGGAGNVVSNLSELGAKPIPIGVVGDDFAGQKLRQRFLSLGAPVEFLVTDPSRPTTVKTRIVAHSQQMIRADRETRSALAEALETTLIEAFSHALVDADAVVVSDYDKGVLTTRVLREVLSLAEGKIVCLDPKIRHFASYQPVTVITPNQMEAERATGIEISDETSLMAAAEKIFHDLRCRSVLITRGEHGMSLYKEGEGGGELTHIPTVAQEVYDVTGAGDTVIAVLALSLAAGAAIDEAANIANHAAGIVVGKVGTATCSLAELRAALTGGSPGGKA